MLVLKDKVAVITGSTRGFGLAIANEFVRQGAFVVLTSRSADAVQKAVQAIRGSGAQAEGCTCDVSDLGRVQELANFTINRFGRMDVWVNNAGITPTYGPTVHLAPKEMRQVIETNVFGTYHGSLVAMRWFLSHGNGKLINILGRGERGPQPMQNGYAASKAWIKSFTLALAKEYKGSGVGVYALSPGMMDTEMMTDVRVVQGFEVRLKVLPSLLQMFSQPPQVPAQKAVWLASPATDGRTGLLVREFSAGKMLSLIGRGMANRLLRRSGRQIEVEVHIVESDFEKAIEEA